MNTSPDLTPQELEKMEKLLESVQPSISPSAEFAARMQKRLERHYVLMQAREGAEATPVMKRGFFSFIGTHAYSVITAFAFVLFTGGLSTFAYTNTTVTNGSPLYPIKRGLEKIESTFISTPEAKAEYQMKLLTRRLDESRFLTSQGVVDELTNQEVSAVVDNGIQAIQGVEQSDYRDQLLDRFTTILLAQESKFYTDAGITPPVATSSVTPAVVVPETPSPSLMMSAEVAPVVPAVPMAAPSPAPTQQVENQEGVAEKSGESSKSLNTQLNARSLDATISTPRAKTDSRTSEKRSGSDKVATKDKKEFDSSSHEDDNITYSLSVKPGVLNAIEKNRKHLKEVENKIKEARRSR